MSQGPTKLNLYSGTLNVGTVVVSTGTVNAGTVDLLKAGTITKLEGGTVQTNIVTGTITSITEVANLAKGTITKLEGGTLGILSQGSINVTAGTITAGSIIVTAGTQSVGTVNTGTINTGTIDLLKAGTITKLEGGTLGILSQGSINVTAGTVITTGGTIQNLNFGTISLSDGTTKGNVMASGVSNGTAAQNAQIMTGAFAEVSGSATAGTADIIASMDVGNYSWVSIQLFGTWVGTVNAQVSNDNTNWLTFGVGQVTVFTNVAASNLTSPSIVSGPLGGRYFRLRMNAFTSGTAQTVTEFYAQPKQMITQGVAAAQQGAYNVTGTIANGSIAVTAGTITAGTVQDSYPSFSYITAAATTTISSAAGILHAVNIGSTPASAGTIYNSAGTTASIIWAHKAAIAENNYIFDLAFGSLTYASPGAGQITIVYK